MSLPDFRQYKIIVVGDVMLDRYWFGEVNRISPEAPVPVVRIKRQEERPGGAANVARNIASLGACSSLLSVIGDDEPGRSLQSLVSKDGIDAVFHIDPKIDTTIKLRVIGRQQQLMRIDFETLPSNDVLAQKAQEFYRRVQDADVVVLSDYDKGSLLQSRELIRMAREAGKPILVDPKGDDYSRYAGATMITPNLAEFKQVVGNWSSEEEFADKAWTLRKALNLQALLVTRSEDGMTLFGDGTSYTQAAVARDVFDVTGAGDTVIAAMAVMHAAGAEWSEAMRVASIAAGIVVGRLGTAAVTSAEVEKAMAQSAL